MIYHLKFGMFFLLVCFSFSLFAGENALRITYPASGDTVDTDMLRIAGRFYPDGTIHINNHTARVFRNGAFIARVPTRTGMNELVATGRFRDSVWRDTVQVVRRPSLQASPLTPTVIDTQLLEPRRDLWLLAGDVFSVRIKGSPNGVAHFSVSDVGNDFPMTELPPSRTGGVPGLYHGLLRIDSKSRNQTLNLTSSLAGVDGKRKRVSIPGKVHVLSDRIPLVGVLRRPADLWNHHTGGARMGSLPAGVRVQVTGLINQRYRIRLEQGRAVYIPAHDIRLLPAGEPLPHARMSTPVFWFDSDWIYLRFPITERVPFLVKQQIDPHSLQVVWFNTTLEGQWTTWPNDDLDIDHIDLEQIGEHVLSLRVDLRSEQLWGYRVHYQNDQCVLAIRRPPIRSSRGSALQGLRVVLDPGHGGTEDGAISSTGLKEKDINLTCARYLAEDLRRAGARVMLTRTADQTLSLSQRLNLARDFQGHLFISLHHNSVGPGIDPLRVQGTSVFWNQPQSRALAWSIYPYLLDTGLDPFGRSFTSFYVTRMTDMISVLIEGAFLSHPEDEMRVSQDSFLQAFSHAIFRGIRDFVFLASD
jgi:N-acetylmuramoyl-L-alanine amidase